MTDVNVEPQDDHVDDSDTGAIPPGVEDADRVTSDDLITRLAGAEGYEIPESVNPDGDGYLVDRDGVWWRHATRDGVATDLIAFKPFLPMKRLRDDKGNVLLELTWLTDDNRTRSVTVPATDAADRAKLMKAFPDFVVTSKSATECSQFIGHCLRANNEWIVSTGEEVATALGWPVTGTDTYVYGSGRPTMVEDVKNTGSWLTWHAQSGTLDAWKAMAHSLAERDLVQVMIAAALAAPLLRVTGSPSFVVDLSGTTSMGKTTALSVAASVAGNPSVDKGILVSWGQTQVSLEHHLAMLRGMSLFLDESQLAEQTSVERLVYSLTDGKSRGRSRQDGSGMMDRAMYETVALSTGEQPLISVTKKGGVVPRVVTLTGTPMGSKTQADDARRAALANHGWALPAFVERLRALDLTRVMTRLAWWKEELSKLSSTPVGGRRADSVAVLALANELASEMELTPRVPLGRWAWIVDGGGTEAENEDRPLAALRDVLAWAESSGSRFAGHDTFNPATGEVLGRWNPPHFVAFVPSKLREHLVKLGYDAPDAILRTWRERKWIECQQGFTWRTLLTTKPVGLIRVIAVDELAAQPGDETPETEIQRGWLDSL